MFLLRNLSDITVSKTTQRPFLRRAGLTAQKIDPLAVENIYNKFKYCGRRVRDRVSRGQKQNPHSVTAERPLLALQGFREEPGMSSPCLDEQKDPRVCKRRIPVEIC